MRKITVFLHRLAMVLLVAGCDVTPTDEGGVIAFGSGRGVTRLDITGSCADNFGEVSPEGCWCDEICEFYQDCCDDKPKVCVQSTLNPSDPAASMQANASCSGYCGRKTPDGCWCDKLCVRIDDCCQDVDKRCSW